MGLIGKVVGRSITGLDGKSLGERLVIGTIILVNLAVKDVKISTTMSTI
jgi:hypothetical protein